MFPIGPRWAAFPSRWHTKIIDAAGRLADTISAGDFLIETPIADSAIKKKRKSPRAAIESGKIGGIGTLLE